MASRHWIITYNSFCCRFNLDCLFCMYLRNSPNLMAPYGSLASSWESILSLMGEEGLLFSQQNKIEEWEQWCRGAHTHTHKETVLFKVPHNAGAFYIKVGFVWYSFLSLFFSFSQNTMLEYRAPPPPEEHDPQAGCQLMDGFGIFIQLCLATTAFSTLIFKRQREQPQRPIRIW